MEIGTCKNIGHTPTIIIIPRANMHENWDWSLGTEILFLVSCSIVLCTCTCIV